MEELKRECHSIDFDRFWELLLGVLLELIQFGCAVNLLEVSSEFVRNKSHLGEAMSVFRKS